MMSYFKNRESVAAFASDTILNSNASLPWTMIIGRDKFGDYYAHTVINTQSEDIEEKPYKQSTTISQENTQAG